MQRAMRRRGAMVLAVASCGRGVWHSRFAVWPARRAKEAGIVIVADRASPYAASMGVVEARREEAVAEGSSK